MVDDKDMAVTLPAVAPRDDEGNLRAEYVDEVVKALDAGNASALRELVGELHEADAGAPAGERSALAGVRSATS